MSWKNWEKKRFFNQTLLTVFLIFASLEDLQAPLVNRVVQETEAVDRFDHGAGDRCVVP